MAIQCPFVLVPALSLSSNSPPGRCPLWRAAGTGAPLPVLPWRLITHTELLLRAPLPWGTLPLWPWQLMRAVPNRLALHLTPGGWRWGAAGGSFGGRAPPLPPQPAQQPLPSARGRRGARTPETPPLRFTGAPLCQATGREPAFPRQ